MSARAAAPARRRSHAAPAPRPRPRPAPAPARPRPRPAARRGRRARPRLGRLLIPLIALILGGVVWVNVAKLTLTNETGRVIAESRSVQAENVRLRSRLEQRNANVVDAASRRLAMELPPLDAVTYLDVPPPAR